jgi:hypothetical protein
VGAAVDPENTALEEIKPVFTNEANRFCKMGGTARGFVVGAAGPDSGFALFRHAH